MQSDCYRKKSTAAAKKKQINTRTTNAENVPINSIIKPKSIRTLYIISVFIRNLKKKNMYYFKL